MDTEDTVEGPMEWLNEPASWQRTGDVLTVSVDPGTDFWRETGYGYIRDSGHVYGEVLAGDLDVSVRMHCTPGAQFDQAGVMLRADARTWVKTGVEFFEGRPRLSTVLTLGQSSWMVTDLPEGTDDIVLRVARRGDAVEIRYAVGNGPAELAALVFLPPNREVLAGVMAAAPEGPGFRVTFQDLHITERDWSGAAGDETAWHDDQAEWAAQEAPAWGPVDGEPRWSPGWPGMAGEDDPDWPARLAADDGQAGAADTEAVSPGPAEDQPAEDRPAEAEPADGEAAARLAGDGSGEPEPARAGAADDEPARHEHPWADQADDAKTDPGLPGAHPADLAGVEE